MTEPERPDDARVEQLLRAADALPREVTPVVDPWPSIRARIEAARVRPLNGAATRHARPAPRSWQLVAAAAVLIIASSAVTMLTMRGHTTSPVAVGAGGVEGAAGAAGTAGAASAEHVAGMTALIAIDQRRRLVTDVCRNYDAAAGDLERVLRGRRDRLSPTTVRVLEQSLRAIDQAIGEARAVLEKDPASQDMLDLLDSVYRQKLDLLRRANALPLRSS